MIAQGNILSLCFYLKYYLNTSNNVSYVIILVPCWKYVFSLYLPIIMIIRIYNDFVKNKWYHLILAIQLIKLYYYFI